MATALPGKELAEALEAESRNRTLSIPMESIVEAAAARALTDDQYFRLIGRLWTMKRMYYYVYGAWGSSLTINEYPPSVDYLFAKQVYDESTHEMLYSQAILHKGWGKFQRSALRHPYCQFVPASGVGLYIFSLRGLGNYAHSLRMAAVDLGPKVLELAWLERLAAALPDEYLQKLFASQVPETRSHVMMGRFMVERFVSQPVDVDLCTALVAMARRDYTTALQEIADFVLTPGLSPQPSASH